MKRFHLLAVIIVTGCSTVPVQSQSKTRMSITDYADSHMKHSEITFEEFAAKTTVKEYYVYSGDRMLGASVLLEHPIFAAGHSIREIGQHGNRIYAIPIYKYRVGFTPRVTYFWLVAERNRKIYMIANAGMEVKDFKANFKRIL